MDFVAQLNRLLDPIRTRIRMIVCRGLLSLVNDSKGIQLVQLNLMKDEVKDSVERVQNYGFTSHPKADAEAVALFVAGNKDHGLCIAIDDTRYRLKNLPEGGVAVYDHDGNYVKLTEANGIEVEAPNQKVTIKASGDIEIGNANLKNLVNEEFAKIFNEHKHGYTLPLHPSTPNTPTSGPSTSLGSGQMTSKVKAE